MFIWKMSIKPLSLFALVFLVQNTSLAFEDTLRQKFKAWTAGYPAEVRGEQLASAALQIQFYNEQLFRSVWFSDGKANDQVYDLLREIESIEHEGLMPENYHLTNIKNLLASHENNDRVELEVLLSDALLTLALHLRMGKTDPSTLNDMWQSKSRDFEPLKILHQVAAGETPSTLFETLRPNQIRYFRLRDAARKLRVYKDREWPQVNVGPAMKPGSIDPRLTLVRQHLHFWQQEFGETDNLIDSQEGFIVTENPDHYDAHLEAAVIMFQQQHGLDTDAIIGKATLDALNTSPGERLQQLYLNMERWRWLDEDFGERFLVVNIADFTLRIYEKNEVVFEKPVIVGRQYRKTPVFSDRLRFIVFNPTWTVPHRLAVEDKLPDIQTDPTYLDRLGFKLYNIGTLELINHNEVDWTQYSRRNFPFRMVQSPGPLNALGQMKFMFPNSHDVYIHDTPGRDLFKKSERAFSSGCIRLADPIELANYLLQNQKWDTDKLNALLESGETKTVYLDSLLPVHVEYWTAWVDRANRLQFRKDIYNRDAPLWAALRSE